MRKPYVKYKFDTFHYNREDGTDLIYNNQNCENCPCNLTKLVFVESFFETQDKHHKDANVENHRNPTTNQQQENGRYE